ncbi:hypothetical protein ACFFMN_22905 [Planobispora siamensis]|uniref:hypothetical protein n=1 Tax=Planobispora siamensis TaxID=936338 RepID=UPI00194F0A83|nr:hypothetical protein [Planobispora siamensis]
MPEYSPTHVWVGAATVPITQRKVRRAYLRQSVRTVKDTKITILEIYCEQCRRPYDDVQDELCSAAQSSKHLKGGPIGVRQKRAHYKHNCALLGCDLSSADDDAEEPSLFDDHDDQPEEEIGQEAV